MKPAKIVWSKSAKRRFELEGNIEMTFMFILIVPVCLGILSEHSYKSGEETVDLIIWWAVFIVGIGTSALYLIVNWIAPWRIVNESNKEDYRKAEIIRRELDKISPDVFLEMPDDLVCELKNLKPIKVEQMRMSSLSGNLQGRWRGLFAGSVEGDLCGTASPDIFSQSFVVLSENEYEESFRLICPSLKFVKDQVERYFDNFNRFRGTYIVEEIEEFLNSEKLKQVVDKIDPASICDRLVIDLAKGKPISPISVKGLRLQQKGHILVTQISNAKATSVVIPINLFKQLDNIFKSVCIKRPELFASANIPILI